MKAVLRWITVWVAALSSSMAVCSADVIYSTLSPGDMEVGGEAVIGSSAVGVLGVSSSQNAAAFFQASSDFSPTGFSLGVDFSPPGYALSPLFNVYLFSDTETSTTLIGGSIAVSHVLNMELAEIAQGLVAPDSPGLVTFNPLGNPLILKADSFYWVVLAPNNAQSSVVWDNESFEVDGTLLTPEPSTLTLLTCALPALLFLRKKHPTTP